MTRLADIAPRPTERDLYFGYLEAGAGEIAGDACAEMAREDIARRELAEFIASQPAHNAPIPVPEDLA